MKKAELKFKIISKESRSMFLMSPGRKQQHNLMWFERKQYCNSVDAQEKAVYVLTYNKQDMGNVNMN